VTFEWKLHQSMKYMTIQPHPLSGIVFEHHEKY
jgi:hypothetical protein